jgi:ABC1 atypical kinase-like domain
MLPEELSRALQSGDVPFVNILDLETKLAKLQEFGSDRFHKIAKIIADIQSTLFDSNPEMDPRVLLSNDYLSLIPPEIVVVAASILSFTLANVILSPWQALPSSRPYPMNKYDALTARAYFDRRPFVVVSRALTIGLQSLRFGFSLALDHFQGKFRQNELQRGRELAALLTRLGPTFIKVGQSLSIRSDLISPAYVRGLETLQDQVPAFDTATARRILETEWGKPIMSVLSEDLTSTPIAAASLGQVYKARLRESNEEIAIKIQRPDITEQIALDMYLIREIGGILKRLTKLNTDIIGTVDAWGAGFVDELDYIQEAANGEKFSMQIMNTPLRDVVFAPIVLNEYTTRSVLVSSWVNGERLDRSDSSDVSVICSIAMNTYLTMLLEFGLLRKFIILRHSSNFIIVHISFALFNVLQIVTLIQGIYCALRTGNFASWIGVW